MEIGKRKRDDGDKKKWRPNSYVKSKKDKLADYQLRRSTRSIVSTTQEADEKKAYVPSFQLGVGRPITFDDCKDILEKLLRHEHAWPFAEPLNVEELGLDDYYTVVKNPMDLSTVKKNLEAGVYVNPIQFKMDMNLIWLNALAYCKKNSALSDFAEELQTEFNALLNTIEKGVPLAIPKKKSKRKGKEADVCGTCGEGGELLICDGDCLRAFHLECVGLSVEPDSPEWFCSTCTKKMNSKDLKEFYVRRKPPGTPPIVTQNITAPIYTDANLLPNHSINPPSIPPHRSSRTKNTGNSTPWASEILKEEEQAYERMTRKQSIITHINLNLSKEQKIIRREGEEQIKATQMIYDPVWCIWKPKNKNQFIRKLGKTIGTKIIPTMEDVVDIEEE